MRYRSRLRSWRLNNISGNKSSAKALEAQRNENRVHRKIENQASYLVMFFRVFQRWWGKSAWSRRVDSSGDTSLQNSNELRLEPASEYLSQYYILSDSFCLCSANFHIFEKGHLWGWLQKLLPKHTFRRQGLFHFRSWRSLSRLTDLSIEVSIQTSSIQSHR